MNRFGLKTAAVALLAGGLAVASVSDANAQYRRRHSYNEGAAVGAAVALGALAIGAIALSQQQRSQDYGGERFIGYDEYGNPVYERQRYVAPRAYYRPQPRVYYAPEPSYGYYAPEQSYGNEAPDHALVPVYRHRQSPYSNMGRSKFQ